MRTRTTKQLVVAYSAAATRCVRRLCVFPPPQRGSQRIVKLDWRCDPPPDEARELADDYGNRILELRHRRIARRFSFAMELVTQRDAVAPVPREVNLPPTGLGAFLLPSALCDLSPAVCAFADDVEKTDAVTRVAAFCARTHRALKYFPHGDTRRTALQALQHGAGVCQDFAHLMIACCRAAKLPARYVAGYNPAEGLMHAWVEVLYDGAWHAWDPTHNRALRPDCVFVACGRDYRDVSPLAGTYHGRAHARLHVRCKTEII